MQRTVLVKQTFFQALILIADILERRDAVVVSSSSRPRLLQFLAYLFENMKAVITNVKVVAPQDKYERSGGKRTQKRHKIIFIF